MNKLKHIVSLEKFFESYSSLNDEERNILNSAVDELKGKSSDLTVINSEVANPKGIAKNPFYDRGARALDGNGESYANIVSGSVSKKDGILTADVEHGVKYNTGKTTKTKSKVIVDLKEKTYSFDQESKSL